MSPYCRFWNFIRDLHKHAPAQHSQESQAESNLCAKYGMSPRRVPSSAMSRLLGFGKSTNKLGGSAVVRRAEDGKMKHG